VLLEAVEEQLEAASKTFVRTKAAKTNTYVLSYDD